MWTKLRNFLFYRHRSQLLTLTTFGGCGLLLFTYLAVFKGHGTYYENNYNDKNILESKDLTTNHQKFWEKISFYLNFGKNNGEGRQQSLLYNNLLGSLVNRNNMYPPGLNLQKPLIHEGRIVQAMDGYPKLYNGNGGNNKYNTFPPSSFSSPAYRFPYEPQQQAVAAAMMSGNGPITVPHRKYKWRILCWVLTNPSNLPTRTIYVKRSWGPRCDKTLYLSTFTNADFPTVGLLDQNMTDFMLDDDEITTTILPLSEQSTTSQNMSIASSIKRAKMSPKANAKQQRKKIVESKQLNSEKARMAWIYIYKKYYNDYDFFYKTDDDTYVIVENLRDYLETKDPGDPEFYGHRFILRMKNVTYMSGGSGFVLTKRALRNLVTIGFKRYPDCIPKGAGEDWKTARCLQLAGCTPIDTRDQLGRERFLVFPPKSHLAGTYPAWYYKYDVDGASKGIGCCSYYPISFHYIRGPELLMIDYFLYRMRVLGDQAWVDTFVPGQSTDFDLPSLKSTTMDGNTDIKGANKKQDSPPKSKDDSHVKIDSAKHITVTTRSIKNAKLLPRGRGHLIATSARKSAHATLTRGETEVFYPISSHSATYDVEHNDIELNKKITKNSP